MPHHPAHHVDDRNGQRHGHIQSPLGGRAVDALRDLLPELWEEGEAFDPRLFGCPGCDVMGQVSPFIFLVGGELMIASRSSGMDATE